AARRWVHYGSSISHCMEADRPTGIWPVIVARRAGLDLQSLAIAGQCQIDQFAARTIRDLDVDLISLKLGINVVNADSMRERAFVPAVHGFLDTVRDGHPDTPIVLVTPIICPVVEDHPGPTVADDTGLCQRIERPADDPPGALTLRRIRDLLTEIAAARQADGDRNLHLLSGLDLFGADDVDDLPDGLHPNPAGYARIADRFERYAFAPEGGPFTAPATWPRPA
ncbi:MAG: GDSL-like Lipase/Acylhydrolase family, partial [Acidimicrobiales bacterium]|nr:GDSL-like Lipase/Acylhydrolase family [Acidimicrobiales bacterium]